MGEMLPSRLEFTLSEFVPLRLRLFLIQIKKGDGEMHFMTKRFTSFENNEKGALKAIRESRMLDEMADIGLVMTPERRTTLQFGNNKFYDSNGAVFTTADQTRLVSYKDSFILTSKAKMLWVETIVEIAITPFAAALIGALAKSLVPLLI